MTDVLKKPVHTALIPLTHIQTLQAEGKLPKNAVSLETPEPIGLPQNKPVATSRMKLPISGASEIFRKEKMKTRLRVLYDKVPSIPKDKKPPCDTCTEAPCCKAFMVELTQDEYDSGLFADYAVKLTEEARNQLKFNVGTVILSLNALPLLLSRDDVYYLEGEAGQPCPYLDNKNRCTIYNDRPVVCRSYTCVGDSRITEQMRTGKTTE